jgi:LysR family transcriptional activator of nhaA
VEFLNYHHLRYFWVVAKEGGLRKAAEKLHVSQPTISAQIAALESVMDEKLFQRGGRALTLTEAGHRVLNYAEEIFSLGQELLAAARIRPTVHPLRVHIGITDSLPKLVSYEIIKPIFKLEQPIQAVCREAKWPTCSANWPPSGWISCWRTNPRPVHSPSKFSTICLANVAWPFAPNENWPPPLKENSRSH